MQKQTQSNNHFYAPHPFSLMGAFAGQLKANGLTEVVLNVPVLGKHMRPVFVLQKSKQGRGLLSVLLQDSVDIGELGAVLCDRKRRKKQVILSDSSCHSIQTMEHEFYECPEYLSNTAAEVERTEEYEYEVRFRVSLPL